MMNKTDKRQCIDEIEFLGKTKEHEKIFIKALKGAVTLKNVENILSEKRKVYNYAYTNIFRKYNVEHSDLYGELDKVWNICLNEKDKSNQEKLVAALAVAAAAAEGAGVGVGAVGLAGGAFAIIFAPIIGAIAIIRIAWVEYKVNKIWKMYKNNTIIYAEKYMEKL